MDQREFVATFKLRQKHVISARFVEGDDHEELYNREKPNQHPIEAITNLTETLDAKQNTLVSGVNIKTINNQDLLGEGNLTIDTGKIDDVLVNGTSVVENKIANVIVPTNNNELENGAGYITGITANDVTTALGFTPYNATNPDEYITKDVDDLTNYTLTSNLSTVALSGSYDDLNNKPTIGNATLTIQKNGTNVGTFTANSVTNSTINISVPTNVSDLNNDSDYQTETEVSTLIGAHNTSTTAHSDIRQDISGIEDLIPAQATISNKLADKDFVNSSVATNTANFIGTFENVSALNNYSGTVTNNDYAFVINSVITDNGNDWSTFADLDAYNKSLLTEFDYAWVVNSTKFDLYRFDIIEPAWGLRVENTTKDAVTLNTAYNRYKATVNNNNVVTWNYEYTLNNSSFTANQWAAINSGITETKVGNYDNHIANTNNPHSVTKTQVGLGNVDNTSDANKPISTATQAALNAKQNTLTTGTGIDITNNVISLKGTQQLSDGTDIDTIRVEGNYFIKDPVSTKGMPELPTSVLGNSSGVANWLCLLLVEKEYGYGTNLVRQTITLTPVCSVPGGLISAETLMFTRTICDEYQYLNYGWTKIDGDITNISVSVINGNATINKLLANYCYICNSNVTTLTLTNVQNTADEIRVIFTVNNNFVLTANQLTFLNYSNIEFQEGKRYIITIKNLYATIDCEGDNNNLKNLIKESVVYKQDKLIKGNNINIGDFGWQGFNSTNYLTLNLGETNVTDCIVKFNLKTLNKYNTILYCEDSGIVNLGINDNNKIYIDDANSSNETQGTTVFQANKNYWIKTSYTSGTPGVCIISSLEDDNYTLDTLPSSGWTNEIQIYNKAFHLTGTIYIGYNNNIVANYFDGIIEECILGNAFNLSTAIEGTDFTNMDCIRGAVISSQGEMPNNGVLTIQKNGTTVNTFSANSANDVTANITVPTTVAELSDSNNYVQNSSLEEAATVAKTGDYNDLINKPTIPTVNDATISFTQGGVNKGSFTLNQSSGATIALDASADPLPSQSGNNGKFLTTNGTTANWATVDALPSQSSNSGKNLTTNGSTASWDYVENIKNQNSGKVTPVKMWTGTKAQFKQDTFANWITSTSPVTLGETYSNCYGAGKFLIIPGYYTANNNYIYSTDGKNWTESTLPLDASLTRVRARWVHDRFISFCTNGQYEYSFDGINWSTGTFPITDTPPWDIAYGNGKFVVVFQNATNTSLSMNKAAYSEDGINWTVSTITNTQGSGNVYWRSIVFFKDKFIAFRLNSSMFAYSSDGISWTTGTVSNYNYGNWYWFAHSDDICVGCCNGRSGMVYSTNGTSWTFKTLPDGYRHNVIYDGVRFIMMPAERSSYEPGGSGFTNTVLISTDGLNWSTSSITIPVAGDYLSVTYGDNKVVAVQDNTINIITQEYNSISTNHPDYLCFVEDNKIQLGNDIIVDDDYNSLDNKPKINNVELSGNKTLSELGIDTIPSQASQSGKFLTTNGSTMSWATVEALPSQTGQSGKFLTTNGTTASWAEVQSGGSSTINTVTKTLTANSTTVNTEVDLSNSVILNVYIGGIYQIPTTHYSMSTSNNETTITFTSSYNQNVDVTVVYATSVGLTNLSYTDLLNKPSINNITLTGNKSLSDLGIQSNLTWTYDSNTETLEVE